MQQQTVRVRFAPSPTGPFHIGGARSALFNWLLARKLGGSLIMRIEDTDLERSTRESEENIKAALKWLGIYWDEGVDAGGNAGSYRQSERLGLYAEYTKQLLAEDKAYLCYCTEAELETERQEMLAKGETPHYKGRCSCLSEEEQKKLKEEGRKPVVRFRVLPGKEIVFNDIVRSRVTFNSDDIGDFVIVKSDGIPVYNYAVVIDDFTMQVTHVVRAEEHLSNTPRQLLIYEAFGMKKPEFAHISLILGKDRSKMSKRHGATSVEQYKNMGYLPEALVNFLALLGWAPNSEQEIFSLEELVEQFSLERVAKNPAVFDIDKLNWINSCYIKKIGPERLMELAVPHLKAAGYINDEFLAANSCWLIGVVAAVQEYVSYAAQVVEHVDIFFNDQFDFESTEAHDSLRDSDVQRVMAVFKERLAGYGEIEPECVKTIIKGIGKELKMPGKKVFMPIRIAITGKMHGPELFNIISLLGKERTIKRIDLSLQKIID